MRLALGALPMGTGALQAGWVGAAWAWEDWARVRRPLQFPGEEGASGAAVKPPPDPRCEVGHLRGKRCSSG